MLFREVVHPAGEAADGSLPGEPVEGDIDRLTAADVQEVCRDKDRTTPATMNGRKYPRINGLWLFLPSVHVRNISLFFLQYQGLFEPELLQSGDRCGR